MSKTDDPLAPLAEGLARVARHFQAGRFEAAVELTRTLDAEHGTMAETQHLRGLARYAMGEREDGLAEIREAADFLPENGNIQADIGALLAQERKYADALPYFEAAVKLAPNYAPGWSNLGGCLFMMEEYGRAIRPLRKAVELDPKLI